MEDNIEHLGERNVEQLLHAELHALTCRFGCRWRPKVVLMRHAYAMHPESSNVQHQ